MGLGAALGAGVSAWQKEETRLLNEDITIKQDDRRNRIEASNTALRNEQMAASRANRKHNSAVRAEYNSTDNKRLRATKIKNETAMLNMQNEIMSAGSKSVDTQTANEVKAVNQKLDDTTRLATNDRLSNILMTDIADGVLPDFKHLNEFIQNEPVLGKMVGAQLIQFNEKDPKHMAGIRQMAQKVSAMQGVTEEDVVESQVYAIQDMAERGMIGMNVNTGQGYDIMGLMNVTGVTQRLPKSTMSNYTNQAKEAGMVGAKKYSDKIGLRETPVWQKDNQPGGMKTYKDHKGNEVNASDHTAMLKMLKMPVPPALEAINKYNGELVKDSASGEPDYWGAAKPEEAEEAFGNILVDVANGNDAPEIIARAKAFVDGKKGKAYESYSAKLQSAIDGAKTRKIFKNPEAEELTGENKVWMENKEDTNLKDVDPMYKKAQDYVRTSISAGKRINGILSNMQSYAKDGSLITGLLSEEATAMLSKDSAAMDKAVDLLKSSDTEKDKQAARIKVDRMLANTININTTLGLELATFIKSMSGAAVSDQERAFLVGIVSAISQGNPYAVGTALESFRDSRLNMNEKYHSQHTMRATLPDTMFTAKTMDKGLRRHYEMPKVDSITTQLMEGESSGNVVTNFFSDMWEGVTGNKAEADAAAQNKKFLEGN